MFPTTIENRLKMGRYVPILRHQSARIVPCGDGGATVPQKIDSVKIVFGEGEGKVLLEVIAERAKKYQPKPKITYKMIQDRESHDFNRGRMSIIVYQRRSDQGRWRLDIILEYKEAN